MHTETSVALTGIECLIGSVIGGMLSVNIFSGWRERARERMWVLAGRSETREPVYADGELWVVLKQDDYLKMLMGFPATAHDREKAIQCSVKATGTFSQNQSQQASMSGAQQAQKLRLAQAISSAMNAHTAPPSVSP